MPIYPVPLLLSQLRASRHQLLESDQAATSSKAERYDRYQRILNLLSSPLFQRLTSMKVNTSRLLLTAIARRQLLQAVQSEHCSGEQRQRQAQHLLRMMASPIVTSLATSALLLAAPGQSAFAQTVVTQINAAYEDGADVSYSTTTANPCDTGKVFICSAPTSITFNQGTANNLRIKTVTAGATSFVFRGLADQIKLRRNDNPRVVGDRHIIFSQNTSAVNGTPILFRVSPSTVSTMEETLLSDVINRGSDNVFANQGDSVNAKNINNIERIDYIINAGLTPTTQNEADKIGFVVLDRGSGDNYKIAPILSLDSAGNPATFGAIKTLSVPSTAVTVVSTGGTLGASADYLVMRKEGGSTLLQPSDIAKNQGIRGHFFSLTDLGIAVNSTVYGYVLFAPDGPTVSADILDWTNTTKFPQNSENTTTGGLDLIAGGGIFSENPLPVSLSSIAGNVFNDVNGTKLQDSGEALINGVTTGGLKAVLVNSLNQVVQTVAVDTNGAYSFANVANGTYSVLLTTTAPTGTTVPPITLPNNWINTGENKSGVAETTTPDSQVSVTVNSANITGVNFGIEQLPTAIGATATSQANPGGTNSVSTPITLFNTSTDPDAGSVTQYRITSFPTNATSLEIDGIVYTSAGGNGTTAFPTTTGVTVLETKLNTIKVDPIDGAVTVEIPFKAIDNAGQESTNTAIAALPFNISAVGSSPQLILLKRITKINSGTIGQKIDGTPIDLTTVVAQPDHPSTPRDESGDAANPNWPTNYPKGAIDAGMVKSGDQVEYTIYFLSIGGKPVTNANFCDWVPKNTTFVPDAYGLGKGIQLAIGSILNTFTNIPDGDRGEFFNPNATPPATFPNGTSVKLSCAGTPGTEGAIVVNLVHNALPAPENQLSPATASGNPDNSYGLVRFVSKVK